VLKQITFTACTASGVERKARWTASQVTKHGKPFLSLNVTSGHGRELTAEVRYRLHIYRECCPVWNPSEKPPTPALRV